MQQGLAATRGAWHYIHIDSDGLGTFIDVKCGGKWWVVFSPPTKLGKHGFGAIDTFLNTFNINRIKVVLGIRLMTSGGLLKAFIFQKALDCESL
jgi:hypothetical protein